MLALANVFCCCFQIQIGDQAMQVVRVESQEFGGLGETALRLLQSPENQLLLGGAHRFVEAGGSCGEVSRSVGEGFGQVFRENGFGGADHDGAFDGVFKLTDISRPIVGSQGCAGGRRQAANFAVGAHGIA